MRPRIAIVGTGAVGGYAGAHMAQAGEDIVFVDFWPENVETMRAKGLRISHIRDVPEFTVKVDALHITDVQQLAKQRPIDIAFVCVKSYDTAWATTMIAQYLAPNGFVVSLQNCMNEETVASIVGWGRTLGSIASSITVDLCEPGHVRRAAGKSGTRHTVFRAGEVHGRITDRLKEVHRLVSYADSAQMTSNFWGERWSKLVTNVMGNGLSACTGLISKDIIQDDTLRHFSSRLGSEAIRVGQALGYELEEILHLPPETIARAGEGDPEATTGGGRPPACRDPESGRRRASPVDGSGHGEGPTHRDPVPQRLHRAQGAGDRVRHTRQCGADRHRHARREGRVAARQAAYHRPAAELREGANHERHTELEIPAHRDAQDRRFAGRGGRGRRLVAGTRRRDARRNPRCAAGELRDLLPRPEAHARTAARFARRWGEIHLHPFMQGMPDYPEILEIIKTPEDKKNFGGSWHTDQMFSPQPAMGTMLYALEVPSAGGDTMFTNQYLAYESLSDGMKALIGQLRTVCVGDNFKQHGGESRAQRYERQMTHMKVKDPGNVQTTSVHPLVRTHPETGRKVALYRRPRAAFRRHDRRGERAADRLPEEALDAAGVHLPVPLAERLAGVLGQSLHAAFRDQRLSGRDADHAPHHGVRRHAVLSAYHAGFHQSAAARMARGRPDGA